MIQHIDHLCREWAAWCAQRVDGWRSTGQFRYVEWSPRATNGEGATPIHARALLTDSGIAWLRTQNRRSYDVTTLYYRDRPDLSVAMMATMLGCSTRGLYRRLDASHQSLLEYLIDRECGIVPQTEELRRGKRIA